MANPKTTKSLVKVSINSPQAMANFATTLKEFIVARGLYTKIKDKNYVNVEGWEFAGASLGIYPIVQFCDRVKEDVPSTTTDEIKYESRVELVMISNGRTVGAGVAICSNKESSKKYFDEYAIASMAQTRAIGKAYRNQFAWLMKMAGYEPTPAEEFTPEVDPTPQVLDDPIEEVRARVNAKLDAMPTVERMRALKSMSRVNTKNLTDSNWRRLDVELGTNQHEAKD